VIIDFEGDRRKDGRIRTCVKYMQLCCVSLPHGIPSARLRLSYKIPLHCPAAGKVE